MRTIKTKIQLHFDFTLVIFKWRADQQQIKNITDLKIVNFDGATLISKATHTTTTLTKNKENPPKNQNNENQQ